MTNEASKAHETQGPTAGAAGLSEAGQGPGMAGQEAVTTLLSIARALSLALDGLSDQVSALPTCVPCRIWPGSSSTDCLTSNVAKRTSSTEATRGPSSDHRSPQPEDSDGTHSNSPRRLY
jgi:hypothetical protein